jgi:hypothetical protein
MKKSTLAIIAVGAVALLALLSFKSKDTKLPLPATIKQALSAGTPAAHPSRKPATAVPPTRATAAQWQTRMIEDTEPLEFVRAALPAAKAGDGRAAYEIARMLRGCAYEMSSADPEAQLQQDLAKWSAKAPQWAGEDMERGARSCIEFAKGFAKENPFGDLPATPEYWMAQAYTAGDALAQVEKAAQVVADIAADPQMPEARRAEEVKVVLDNLRAAVESRDPEALYRTGMLFTDLLVRDTVPGYAVALAACDLGYDCSTANPESLEHECAQNGSCPPGEDFPTLLQQGMTPEQYAALYARSQEVVLAVRAGDYDAVLANLMIDLHPHSLRDSVVVIDGREPYP